MQLPSRFQFLGFDLSSPIGFEVLVFVDSERKGLKFQAFHSAESVLVFGRLDLLSALVGGA